MEKNNLFELNFKNVGQGDTIFVSWKKSNDSKQKSNGLIDCNLINNGIEPIIEHIRHEKITEFDFVIMSHPHTDHFSGFMLFFNYCLENNITIKEFHHTACFDPKRLNQLFRKEINPEDFCEKISSSVYGFKNIETLLSIYDFLNQQRNLNTKGIIKEIFTTVNNKESNLSDKLKMKFLAPNSLDIDKYFTETFNTEKDTIISFKSKYENNPKANLISTVIQFYDIEHEWQIILFSDTTIYNLKRIMENSIDTEILTKYKLLCIQIPHHGSRLNHYEPFWDLFENKHDVDSVISVGKKYGHPHQETVNYFKKKFRSFHATNCVGSVNGDNFKLDDNPFYLLPSFNPTVSFKKIKTKNEDCGEKHIIIKNVNGEIKHSVDTL